MDEQWRAIRGLQERYEVSDFGRVRSLSRSVKRNNSWMTVKGQFMNPWLKNRFMHVELPGRTVRSIHSLVTEAFIGKRPDGWEVNHINGDRLDNRLFNLEYIPKSWHRALLTKRAWHKRKTASKSMKTAQRSTVK